MPEGPEVAIVTDYLIERITDTKIIKIYVDSEWLEKCHRDQLAIESDWDRLVGQTIREVDCYCKRLFFHLDKTIIVSSLGMEGMWTLKPWRDQEHYRMIVTLTRNDDEEEKKFKLYYQNTRPIGFISTIKPRQYEQYIAQFGFDVLRQTPSLSEFTQALEPYSNTQIKSIFTKEKGFVCSVGNYLRSEILYAAKIAPTRKVSSLTKAEIKALRYKTIEITRKAYHLGGMTSNSFYSPEHKAGKYKALVYGRTVDDSGNQIEKIKSGQSLYWVPEVQV